MRTLRSRSLLVICLSALPLLALTCNPAPTITILSPTPLETLTSCSVELQFQLVGAFGTGPDVTLNFAPLPSALVEGPPGTFTATLEVEDLLASNVLIVKADRASDGETLTQGVSFQHAPKASAFEITDAADLLTGPLAHNRVGDFMLESCVARFVIQDGGQRDLYSVGQFGGNLIDAERIGKPGLDNFLEVTAMVNVETVINAETVVVVNDGDNGSPAVVRACGPDDLLDFVNPSSQVVDLGLPFPAALNDNNQALEGCTDFSLSGADSHIQMETTFTNLGATDITLLSGDWMNPGGELDVIQTPNLGVGPALANTVGTMGFFGFDDARGVDYSYTSTPATPGSYVVISGVIVVLHSSQVVAALLGLDSGVTVPPAGSHTMTRFFGVGDGSGSNAVDLEAAIKGLPSAHLEGCVTIDGSPAPAATVTVGGFLASGALNLLATSFQTDDAGCYAGSVPLPGGPVSYGVAAAKRGVPYEGGGLIPAVTTIAFSPGGQEVADFDLPASGRLEVTVIDQDSNALPSRITVVGFDTSPPIRMAGPALPGFGGSTLGVFENPDDSLRFGIVRAEATGADGIVAFDLEPGDYQVVVSRGTEYSTYRELVTTTAGAVTQVAAQIAHVLDTDGFVSSDFHVHGINSADSRVSHEKRVVGYSGEGVDNIVMTDHHVHTDLNPTIVSLGLQNWVSATIGEEITTFDYGHFNGYPFTIDATRISGGSTDWGVAAPPGLDFPSDGAFNATPAEIFSLATTGTTSTANTTVQINHIDSHFEPMRIDTSLVPPQDGLDAAARLERRLDEPVTTNLFFPFPALELWNGESRGAQSNFLDERIGIWFNLLNQGIETTFIADTDAHRHTNLGQAGARTWTAAGPTSDSPGNVDPEEVGAMVDAGKAVGGQGLFVTAVLRATDGSGDQADFTRNGTTHVSDTGGNVVLDIRVQAPDWAPWNEIEIYSNATTTPVDPANPFLYSATPSMTLFEGDCDETTTGDGDFDITVSQIAAFPGAVRLETNVSVPFNGLTEDTWFVVIARGTDGTCPAMFPVFPASLSSATNTNLAGLIDDNVNESGVMPLGATNALYFGVPLP